jgi:hypothetical protein
MVLAIHLLKVCFKENLMKYYNDQKVSFGYDAGRKGDEIEVSNFSPLYPKETPVTSARN